MTVKMGQVWESFGENEFRVIDVVDVENKTWVHYINEKTGQEYSCFLESFISRFSLVANRHQGEKNVRNKLYWK